MKVKPHFFSACFVCALSVYLSVYLLVRYFSSYEKSLILLNISQKKVGNMGGRYKPPKEVQGARFHENLEIHVRRQEVTFAEY